MTWRAKDTTTIKLKGTRVIKVFAFTPIKIGTETKWLEVCYIRQRTYSTNHECGWKNVCFVDKTAYAEYVAMTSEEK